MTMRLISDSDFLVCSRSGKAMLSIEIHRAEQRAVLEQDAEQFSGLVESVFGEVRHVAVADPDMPAVGLEQPDEGLEEDRLARAGGPEEDGDLPRGQRERHVAPDDLTPEGLRQSLDPDLDAHTSPFVQLVRLSAATCSPPIRYGILRRGIRTNERVASGSRRHHRRRVSAVLRHFRLLVDYRSDSCGNRKAAFRRLCPFGGRIAESLPGSYQTTCPTRSERLSAGFACPSAEPWYRLATW